MRIFFKCSYLGFNLVRCVEGKIYFLKCLLEDNGCVHNGVTKNHGDVFKVDKCTVCLCDNGTVTCDQLRCNDPGCPIDEQYLPADECCPVCRKRKIEFDFVSIFDHTWVYFGPLFEYHFDHEMIFICPYQICSFLSQPRHIIFELLNRVFFSK